MTDALAVMQQTEEAPSADPVEVEATPVDDDPNKIWLYLADEKFECRRVAVTWHLMRYAKIQKSARTIKLPHGDTPEPAHLDECKACSEAAEKRNSIGTEALVVMYDVLQTVLKPAERDRFDEFMSTAELKPNQLETAIGNIIGAMSSGDEEGKEKQPTT